MPDRERKRIPDDRSDVLDGPYPLNTEDLPSIRGLAKRARSRRVDMKRLSTIAVTVTDWMRAILMFHTVRDTVTRQCPQTTTSEEKGEPKRIRTEVPPLTSLTPYRLAKPAHKGSVKEL